MDVRIPLITAIDEARTALETGNYPFGAVIVDSCGEIVATGHNENFSVHDISAHAEIQCLRKIDIRKLLDKKNEFYIYCSGEPCGGCSFFIARATAIKHITWALADPQKAGFDDLRKHEDFASFFDHVEVLAEPLRDMRDASSLLLREFYKRLGQTEKARLY